MYFQFREHLKTFMSKSPCFKEEKKSLESCHQSQSFFNGINLMQGQVKTQTLSTNITNLPDSHSRVSSQHILFLKDFAKYFCKQQHQDSVLLIVEISGFISSANFPTLSTNLQSIPFIENN